MSQTKLTREHVIMAQLMVAESLIDHLRDQLPGTCFDTQTLRTSFSLLYDGIRLAQDYMSERHLEVHSSQNQNASVGLE